MTWGELLWLSFGLAAGFFLGWDAKREQILQRYMARIDRRDESDYKRRAHARMKR